MRLYRVLWLLLFLIVLSLCVVVTDVSATTRVDSGIAGQPVVSDVTVTNVRPDGFAVYWRTDVPSDGRVVVDSASDSPSAWDKRGSDHLDYVHFVELSGLQPGRKYLFHVESGGRVDDNQGRGYAATTRALRPASGSALATLSGTSFSSVHTWIDLEAPDTVRKDAVYLGLKNGGYKRPLLYFDLSSIPPRAEVSDATLYMRTDDYYKTSWSLIASIYAVRTTWTVTNATWNMRTATDFWGSPGCDMIGVDRDGTAAASTVVDNQNTDYYWQVTDLVQDWIAHPERNQGLIIIG